MTIYVKVIAIGDGVAKMHNYQNFCNFELGVEFSLSSEMDNESVRVEAMSDTKCSDESVDLRCEEILPSRSGSNEKSSESDSDESLFSIGCFRHFPVTLKEKSE